MSNDKENDDFEYNDGLGDMLREKEQREFSWTKTATVVVVIIVVVIFSFFLSFQLGKKMFAKKGSSPDGVKQMTQQDIQDKLDKMDSQNVDLISKIESQLSSRTMPESVDLMASKAVAKVDKIKEVVPAQPVMTTELDGFDEESLDDFISSPEGVKSPAPVVKKQPVVSTGLPYKIIAGSFKALPNAKVFAKKLEKEGYGTFIWPVMVKDVKWFRVQIGAFPTYSEAKVKLKVLTQKGYSGYILKK